METLYVVMESYYRDYDDHSIHPVGVYSSEELALNAIERARLQLSKSMTFEEFLEQGDLDPEYDHNTIVHNYTSYLTEIDDRVYDFSWYIKEFKLDGAE